MSFESFSNGYDAARGPESMSLAENSARWNAMTQSGLGKPTSVLQQISPSPNAMSGRDAARELPGGNLLPTANGQAEDSYQSGTQMLMRGVENQYNSPVGTQP